MRWLRWSRTTRPEALSRPRLTAEDVALLRALVQKHAPGAQSALAAVLTGSSSLEDREPLLDALSEEQTVAGIDGGLHVNEYGVRLERLIDVLAFDENFPLVIDAT